MKLQQPRTNKVLFITLLPAIITVLIVSNTAYKRLSPETIVSPVDVTPPVSGPSSLEIVESIESSQAQPSSAERMSPSAASITNAEREQENDDVHYYQGGMHPSGRLELTTSAPDGLDLIEPIRIETDESRQRRERLERKAASGSHPDKAVQFRNLQLKDENGRIPLDGLHKARKQMDRMRDRQRKQAELAGRPVETEQVAAIIPGDWTWLGPGNVGGRIRSMVVHPTDPAKLWAGSVGGGIWKSTNAGVDWAPVGNFVANLAVSTMVMDPTNSNIMYAGTGELFAAGSPEGEGLTADGLRGDGVFKTTDGGVTWDQLASTRSSDPAVCGGGGFTCPWSYVNRLAISADGSTLLAATINGIWRSTDGGMSWASNGTFVPGQINRFDDIDFDPANSLLAIVSQVVPIMGATRTDILYSLDGGLTFTAADHSTDGGVTFTATITGRAELAYAPSNPLIVYASVNQSTGMPPNQTDGELFRSNDGGQNFVRVNSVLAPGNTLLGGQGGYDNIVWVNPQDPTFVIIGGVNMYRSTDSGLNFTAIATGQCGSAHSDHHMIVSHPGFDNNTNKIAYFSNDGGVYRADDVSTVSIGAGPQPNTCFTTPNGWTKLNNNLGVTQFYGGTANSAGVIIGGSQDNGTVRYSSDPQAWSTVSGGDGGFVAADPLDNNYFYDEYITLGIKRSTDGGANSSFVYCNPVPTSVNGGACTGTGITDAFISANFIAPFILDPNDPNRMLAGGIRLWRSNDIKNTNPAQNNGLPTWTAIKPPIAPRPPLPMNTPSPTPPVSAIAVSKTNSDLIVVGHNDGQIYLTFDGTGTNPPPTQQCPLGFSPCWSRIDNATTPSRFVTRLVIDETRSPIWIYATYGGFADGNVRRSTDLGQTWTDVSGAGATSLPSVPVRSLVINEVRPDFLYVGTEVGVFASEDAGATWQLPPDTPANVSVDELFWLDGKLVAVTHGRGMYKSEAIYTSNNVICAAPPNCPCFGFWDCPCNWNSGHVPTASDDISIQCNTVTRTGHGPVIARNMRVNKRLSGVGVSVVEDIVNFGEILSDEGVPGVNVSARNLTNLNASIVVSGSIFASGIVTNGGTMALGTNLEAAKLTNSAVITTGGDVNLSSDLANLATGAITTKFLRVAGNIQNTGSLNGTNLILPVNSAQSHIVSGGGNWNFLNGNFPQNQTVAFGTNVSFNIDTFFNSGTINLGNSTLNFTGKNIFSNTGVGMGTGTIVFAPSDGSMSFPHQSAEFTPSIRVASGSVEYESGGVIGGLTIDPGSTFVMNTFGSLTVNGDVMVDGGLVTALGTTPTFIFNGSSFSNNGSVGNMTFFNFNLSGMPKSQVISGTGTWTPRFMQIGDPLSPTTLTAQTDIAFTSSQLITATGSELNIGNKTLTLNGPMTNTHSGRITGTGLVRVLPSTAGPTGPFAMTVDPAMEIVSGTLRSSGAIVGGPLTIDPGATLSLSNFVGITANGDVTNNGTINSFSDNPSFSFKGGTFTNNGTVTGNVFVNFGSFFGPPLTQALGGTGSWAGSPRLLIDSPSTTTLISDVTYNGGNLWIEGRLNTGAFSLRVPCTTLWSGSGEAVGNIIRTNLAACPGSAFAFGSPFTTIQFTSGTPPTEITVNTILAAPAGFPNAALRTYIITPTGGSGYMATLRLHYLDSELNGNAESTLQLWRNDGSIWNAQGATDRSLANNWVEFAGVTQFSPWAISAAGPAPTPTPSPASTPAISGSVAASIVTKPIPDVLMSGAGSPNVSVVTDADGTYLLTGIGSGAYTVTPSKAAQECGINNGIFANDASLVSRHVVGLTVLTGDALLAANVSGTETLSSFDAGLIARRVVGLCTGSNNAAGQWRFTPVSRNYNNVLAIVPNENYTAYLMGDVNGDWNPLGAGRPINPTYGPKAVRASLSVLAAGTGSVVAVPLRIENLRGAGVGSYQFDVEYDPAVVVPSEIAADLSGTLSADLSVAYNTAQPGRLRIAVFGAIPANGDGTYVKLHFIAVGKPGSTSPLTISGFRLNQGTTVVAVTAGQVTVTRSKSSVPSFFLKRD